MDLLLNFIAINKRIPAEGIWVKLTSIVSSTVLETQILAPRLLAQVQQPQRKQCHPASRLSGDSNTFFSSTSRPYLQKWNPSKVVQLQLQLWREHWLQESAPRVQQVPRAQRPLEVPGTVLTYFQRYLAPDLIPQGQSSTQGRPHDVALQKVINLQASGLHWKWGRIDTHFFISSSEILNDGSTCAVKVSGHSSTSGGMIAPASSSLQEVSTTAARSDRMLTRQQHFNIDYRINFEPEMIVSEETEGHVENEPSPVTQGDSSKQQWYLGSLIAYLQAKFAELSFWNFHNAVSAKLST
jgi:hypothetical protein